MLANQSQSNVTNPKVLMVLKRLCAYGIQYMSHKSYKERFILIALTVMIPGVIVVTTLGSHIFSQTQMIQKEAQAVTFLQHTYQLMFHIQAQDVPAMTAEADEISKLYATTPWFSSANPAGVTLIRQLQKLEADTKNNKSAFLVTTAKRESLLNQLVQQSVTVADEAGLMNDPRIDVAYLGLTLRRIMQLTALSENLLSQTTAMTQTLGSEPARPDVFMHEYLETLGMFQDKINTIDGNMRTLFKRLDTNQNAQNVKYQELYQQYRLLKDNWEKNHDLIRQSIDLKQGYVLPRVSKVIQKHLQSTVHEMEPVFEACAELLPQAIQARWWDATGASTVALLVAVGKNLMLIFWLLSMYLLLEQSIRHIQTKVSEVATGNLKVRLTSQAQDELSGVTEAINHMIEAFSMMVSALKQDILSLKQQAQVMIEASHSIQSQAQSSTQVSVQAIDKLQEVANDGTALDKNNQEIVQSMADVNDNVQTVNQASEDLQHSIHTIASSLEEMTAVLGEISQHTGKAVQVSDNVKVTAKQTQQTIMALEIAANKISQVVDVIKAIASQTSLLALNATIEAANSGEAGHGFAVVATEVKALAKKASQATDDIRDMVTDIQQNANQSIAALTHFDDIVVTMNELNQAIAAAVEEQTAAMHEISQSMQQASGATERMNHSIHHTAESASNVTQQAKITSEKLASMTLALKLLVRPSQRLLMQCAEEEQALYLETNMEKVEHASKDTLQQVQRVIETSEELKDRTEHLAHMAEQFQT